MNRPWETAGLSEEEYGALQQLLGREPEELELSLFGVLWSEHCSYKHTRRVLTRFPTRGEAVLQGPGENAGVVRLDPELAAAFKVESHNHPSAVAPFAGAATGVGGVVRDVAALGARPVLTLTALRLGPAGEERTRELAQGALAGAGSYTRGLQVPGARPDLRFAPCYRGNPLVNAMAVGVLSPTQLVRGSAPPGEHLLVVLGAATDRQGVAGASFASEELAYGAGATTSVPTGDPELERRLLLACRELVAAGIVKGMQDLGAAGIAAAAAEMADRGGVGVELTLEEIPARVSGLTPRELLLAETQERMLLAVAPRDLEHVVRVAREKQLEMGAVGRVIAAERFRVFRDRELLLELPVAALTRGFPQPVVDSREPRSCPRSGDTDSSWPEVDWSQGLKTLLSHPDFAWRCAPRPWAAPEEVWEQGEAAVLDPGEGHPGLAAALVGDGRRCFLDPRAGGVTAVAECARKLACVGARPLGLTDGINFGNPENPEVFWQLEEMVTGMSQAASQLEIPVVSGNVSAYNESPGGAICPTPVVGMVGGLPPAQAPLPAGWQRPDHLVLLLGSSRARLEGSAYAAHVTGRPNGVPVAPDLEQEGRLHELLRAAAAEGLLSSAASVMDGGVMAALARASLASAGSALGAEVENGPDVEPLAAYYGEGPPRALVSLDQGHLPRLQSLALERQVPLALLGRVILLRLLVGNQNQGGQREVLLETTLEELRRTVMSGLDWLEGTPGQGGGSVGG